MPLNGIIPWKRFWTLPHASLHRGDRDGGGFLTDPEHSLGRYYNRATFTLEQLVARPCLVLCGEPGMGKTKTIDNFRRSNCLGWPGGHPLIFEELRTIPDTQTFGRRVFETEAWRNWRASADGQMVLVVDGVDEGRIKIPGFVEFLTEELRRVPRERLQLVLLCRTLDWPAAEGEQLFSLWPRPEGDSAASFPAATDHDAQLEAERRELVAKNAVFELCPLRREDAVTAAAAYGVDAEAFLAVVHERRVEGLAARPVTLFMLLEEFARGKALSGGYRELYRRHIRALCEDPDQTRARRLPADQRPAPPARLHRAAGRLAALYLLCGRSAFFLGRSFDVEEGDLTLDDCTDEQLEVDGEAGFRVERTLVEQTLGTALFWSKGAERFHFAHQTFAESLAAEYLTRLPMVQLRQLLCGRDADGEHIIPPLTQPAGWVAADRPDFFDFLLQNEPEVLLRADLGVIPVERRQALVGAFLERAKAEKFFDRHNQSFFYAALNHPGLAEQLWPYIEDSSFNLVVRRVALDIAVTCKLTILLPRLLDLLRPCGGSPVFLDHFVTSAIDDLATPQNAALLVPVLRGEDGWAEVADARLRRSCLYGLLKTIWTVTDALPYLSGCGERHDLVGYFVARHLRSEDVAPALREMVSWTGCLDFLHGLHTLVDKVCTAALRRMEEPELAALLACFCWARAADHSFGGSHNDEFFKLLANDTAARRRLLAAIVAEDKPPGDEDWPWWQLGTVFFTATDLDWALERLEEATGSKEEAPWAGVVSRMFRLEALTLPWGRFRSILDRSVALQKTHGWLTKHTTREAAVVEVEAAVAEQERRLAALRPRRPPPAPPEKLLARDLGKLAEGKHEWWVVLCSDLSRTEGDPHEPFGNRHDVTASPGWSRADEGRRELIRQAARNYLLHCQDVAQLPPGQLRDEADAGYQAICLLRDAIPGDTDLRKAIAASWVPAVVYHFGDDEVTQREMTQLIYAIAPEAATEALVRQLERDSRQESGLTHALRPFVLCWNSALRDAVIGFVASTSLKAATLDHLLDELAELDPVVGLELTTAIFRAEPPFARHGEDDDLRAVALSQLMARRAPEFWDEITAAWASGSPWVETAFYRLASEHRHSPPELDKWREEQLADFYLALVRRFPTNTDPGVEPGVVHTPTARMGMTDFKRLVLDSLTARGTVAACAELLRIAAAVPPDDRLWILWKHKDAQDACRRVAWQKVDPATLLRMVGRAEARLVRDEDDLLALVVESLGRLEEQLVRRPDPRMARLWNYEGAGTKKKHFSPKDEDDLSREIRSWLEDDLGTPRGLVLNREVHFRPGQRTDITVDAMALGAEGKERLTLAIEVKGCWNAEVKTALATQLVRGYLAGNSLTHGLYVIGWFLCERWDHPRRKVTCRMASRTFEDARQEAEGYAVAYAGAGSPYSVHAMVLDCRHPAGSSSASSPTAKPRARRKPVANRKKMHTPGCREGHHATLL